MRAIKNSIKPHNEPAAEYYWFNGLLVSTGFLDCTAFLGCTGFLDFTGFLGFTGLAGIIFITFPGSIAAN